MKIYIETYGYQGNYGAHALMLRVRNGRYSVCVWYSYKTIVAFLHDGDFMAAENKWGPTTGKHLNMIDGGAKPSRVPHEVMIEKLKEILESKFDGLEVEGLE